MPDCITIGKLGFFSIFVYCFHLIDTRLNRWMDLSSDFNIESFI